MPAPFFVYLCVWFVFSAYQYKLIISTSLLNQSNPVCFYQLEHILSICICVATYIS